MRTLSFLLGLFICSNLLAARIVDVAPIKVGSQHAGKMAGVVPCAPANSWFTDFASVPVNPVTGVRHVYHLNFHEVSGIKDQTVTIKIRKDSFFDSRHSQGGADAGGNTQGPVATFNTDWESPEFTVPKNGMHQVEIWFVCTSVNCRVDFLDGANVTRAQGSSFNCNIGPAQACMRGTSVVAFQITVKEPEGALTATVNPVVHRCNGWIDTVRGSLSTMPVCGGKPF